MENHKGFRRVDSRGLDGESAERAEGVRFAFFFFIPSDSTFNKQQAERKDLASPLI